MLRLLALRRRSWRNPVAIALAVILSVGSWSSPAAAGTFTFGPVYTLYMEVNGAMYPTNIGETSPASVDIAKWARLTGLSSWCGFQAATAPTYSTIGYNFGTPWQRASEIHSSGDIVTSGSGHDTVRDTNQNGSVMQDYQLVWPNGYIHGRTATIFWRFAVAYGPNCTSDNYERQYLLSS